MTTLDYEEIGRRLCEDMEGKTIDDIIFPIPLTDKLFAALYPVYTYNKMSELFGVSNDTILRRKQELVDKGTISPKPLGRSKNTLFDNVPDTYFEQLIEILVLDILQRYGLLTKEQIEAHK